MNDSQAQEITNLLGALVKGQTALFESQVLLNKQMERMLHLLELQKVGTALAVESFRESLVKEFGGDVVANWLKKVVGNLNADSGVLMT